MGSALADAWSVDDLARLARRRLPRPVFDFYDGGAEDECTLRANALAFERHALVPRAFVDVSTATTRTRLLDADAAMPLAIAPLGGVGFAWRDGDIALARAAAAAGVPYTLSTMAATTIEQVARHAPGRLWFQAHLLQPRERTLELVDRAAAAGYEALMITADLPVGGKRERDLRNDLALPFRLTRRNFPAFAARPAWSLDMLLRRRRRALPTWRCQRRARPAVPRLPATSMPLSTGTRWRELRSRWRGKLVVKGILHAADAERAVQAGVDAVVVSNHGGRQLDGCIATLDALPAIVAAVGGRATVLVDGRNPSRARHPQGHGAGRRRRAGRTRRAVRRGRRRRSRRGALLAVAAGGAARGHAAHVACRSCRRGRHGGVAISVLTKS